MVAVTILILVDQIGLPQSQQMMPSSTFCLNKVKGRRQQAALHKQIQFS